MSVRPEFVSYSCANGIQDFLKSEPVEYLGVLISPQESKKLSRRNLILNKRGVRRGCFLRFSAHLHFPESLVGSETELMQFTGLLDR